ncbi:COX15/CtaA family protein [Haloplanus halobius]|uniref:COX15/CtaA family protein n=1 Tax=Haloplanus halobius TaxID=2934938 RepID=UPI0024B0EC1E|nr:COX15/CtaA family protein [Haloplanus sp. XH21]
MTHSISIRSVRTLPGADRLKYYHLSGSVLIGTYVLMLLGAYTSAIGAGLSCPDWPTCYGTVVPFLHPEIINSSPYTALQIFAEWAHRGVAMVVGLGILTTAGAAYRLQKQPLVRRAAAVALLLLPVQVVLGGLTVTANLQPLIVTSHLGTAIVILLMLCTTTVIDYVTHRLGIDASRGKRSLTKGD